VAAFPKGAALVEEVKAAGAGEPGVVVALGVLVQWECVRVLSEGQRRPVVGARSVPAPAVGVAVGVVVVVGAALGSVQQVRR